MKKTLEIGDLVKINYMDNMISSSVGYFAILEELRTEDSFLYLGKVLIPTIKSDKLIGFFEFQVKKNFGNLTYNDLIENYPEYLIWIKNW